MQTQALYKSEEKNTEFVHIPGEFNMQAQAQYKSEEKNIEFVHISRGN